MEQTPSCEANRFSASQEIPRILWNPKVHNCMQKRSPPVPILSQINPVHASPLYILKINFILSSHLHLALQSSLFYLHLRNRSDLGACLYEFFSHKDR